MAEGWIFLRRFRAWMVDYHSYSFYWFLFLSFPSLFIVIICPAFSLQLPYKMSQLPPSTTSYVMLHMHLSCPCSLSTLHCRTSYKEQGRGEQKACDFYHYMFGELLDSSRTHNTL